MLDWQGQELERMSGGDFRKAERMKMASWIKPKTAHEAMVYSFLQRRIPIIFSIRGEESVKPGENAGDKPTKIFKSVCNSQFPYEVTVSFRLETERKGYIDLSDPRSFKMEGAHQAIFRHGDRISEEHGERLAAWAFGAATQALAAPNAGRDVLFADAREAAGRGSAALTAFRNDLPEKAARALESIQPELDQLASDADARDGADDFPGGEALRAAEKASA